MACEVESQIAQEQPSNPEKSAPLSHNSEATEVSVATAATGTELTSGQSPVKSNATVTSDSESSSSAALNCFFPKHKQLDGEYPRRVVKYANRRLVKAKIVPCSNSMKLPQLEHATIELDKMLGEGSFSSVYAVRNIRPTTAISVTHKFPPSEEIVVKVLRKKILGNPAMLAACAADLVKEGLLLARCQNEHILPIHAWAPAGVESYRSGRHDSFFLVLGVLKTTLSDKLRVWRNLKFSQHANLWNKVFPKAELVQQKVQSVQERVQILKDIAKGVAYLHSQNILHRDLKPDNIGFDAQGVLKIFDFDVARLLPIGRSASLNNSAQAVDSQLLYNMTRRVGSPRYMSPECARGDPYNAKADVYTVSLLVHELYSLDKPYDDIPAELHDDMVFHSGARPPLTRTWPAPLQRFLERSWSEEIENRPSMEEFVAQWTILMPILVADKQRKYTKFSWRKPTTKQSTPGNLPYPSDDTGNSREMADHNIKNVPFFLSQSSRVEAGMSSFQPRHAWETSARATLSSCETPEL